jgi:hypothetical protein
MGPGRRAIAVVVVVLVGAGCRDRGPTAEHTSAAQPIADAKTKPRPLTIDDPRIRQKLIGATGRHRTGNGDIPVTFTEADIGEATETIRHVTRDLRPVIRVRLKGHSFNADFDRDTGELISIDSNLDF